MHFDDNLIQDAVNLGYPRHRVVDALQQLFSAGKPCNDMNVLLDALEPGVTRGGAQRSVAVAVVAPGAAALQLGRLEVWR